VPAQVKDVTPQNPRITVALSSDPTVVAEGQVREVSPRADPVTGTFAIRVRLIDAPAGMRLGSTVKARMHLDSSPVITIPASALTRSEGTSAVWIVDPRASTVSLRKIEVGASDTTEVQVGRGLSPGDVVVTAGPILKTPHATIQPGWLEEGAFASLVDYDSYWHRHALKEADKFCTDDIPQLEYYKTIGYFQDIPPVYAELGELVTGRKPGRESPAERTMTCNLGLALDDMATAPLVFKLAVEKGLGTRLPL